MDKRSGEFFPEFDESLSELINNWGDTRNGFNNAGEGEFRYFLSPKNPFAETAPITFCIGNGWGRIATRQEFEEITERWGRFYEHYSDEEIAAINHQAALKFEKEYYKTHPRFKKTPQPKQDEPGFVYLIKAETNDGIYKIGKAKNTEARIKSFLRLPFKISLIHQIASNAYSSAEFYLHNKYQNYRLNGEWFRLPEVEVKWLTEQHRLDF